MQWGHRLLSGIPAKNTQSDSTHEKTSDKFKLRENLWNNWSIIIFKSINVMKVPEKLENYFRLKLTKELWQVNTTLDSQLAPLFIKVIIGWLWDLNRAQGLAAMHWWFLDFDVVLWLCKRSSQYTHWNIWKRWGNSLKLFWGKKKSFYKFLITAKMKNEKRLKASQEIYAYI